MKNIIIPSVSALFFIYTIYHNINNSNNNNNYNINNKNENDALLLQKELKTKCENIIIDEFILMLKKNENINLEDAILNFENSNSQSLNDFSEMKGRNKKVYIDTYTEYFIEAKKRYLELC